MNHSTNPVPTDEQVPATNCLDGIRCPACGSTQRFKIVGSVVATMVDNGSDETESIEWGPVSAITCTNCQHTGTVAQFQASETITCRECGNDVFVSIEGTPHHWAQADEPYSDHGSYVDHELDADHVAIPDVNENQPADTANGAQPSDPRTVEVYPAQLTGGETIVGDAGGHLVISGEVYASSSMPGMYAVENEFGTLYLDADLTVQILDEN